MSKSEKNPSIARRIWDRVIKNTSGVFNSDGRASLDPKPMAIPVGLSVPESLDMKLARLFRQEHFLRSLREEGLESFEESQDFDLDDDEVDPVLDTPYQRHAALAALQAVDRGHATPPDYIAGRAAQERIREARKAKSAAKSPKAIVAEDEPDLI